MIKEATKCFLLITLATFLKTTTPGLSPQRKGVQSTDGYMVASQAMWAMQWDVIVSVLHREKHQGSERVHRLGCKEGKETPEHPSRKYISISQHVTPPTCSVIPERLQGRAPRHSDHSQCPWMPLDGTALGWDTWTFQFVCLFVLGFSLLGLSRMGVSNVPRCFHSSCRTSVLTRTLLVISNREQTPTSLCKGNKEVSQPNGEEQMCNGSWRHKTHRLEPSQTSTVVSIPASPSVLPLASTTALGFYANGKHGHWAVPPLLSDGFGNLKLTVF